MEVNYREKTEEDNEIINKIIRGWGSDIIVSRGQKYTAKNTNGILAFCNNNVVGICLYNIVNNNCEIVLLEVFEKNKGIGTELIKKTKDISINKNCKRIWVVTSNDNIDALRFYQKCGFIMANIYINSFDKLRKIKPEIPLIGNYNIPIRDEIELEIIINNKKNNGVRGHFA
ncbi:N-acetyltransferase [Spirochaetia bacterium]|nr:N-acetyltransferase [Spirochaetia bacterium]